MSAGLFCFLAAANLMKEVNDGCVELVYAPAGAVGMDDNFVSLGRIVGGKN